MKPQKGRGGVGVFEIVFRKENQFLAPLVTYVIGYIYYCLVTNLCQSYGDRAVNYTIQSNQSYF